MDSVAYSLQRRNYLSRVKWIPFQFILWFSRSTKTVALIQKIQSLSGFILLLHLKEYLLLSLSSPLLERVRSQSLVTTNVVESLVCKSCTQHSCTTFFSTLHFQGDWRLGLDWELVSLTHIHRLCTLTMEISFPNILHQALEKGFSMLFLWSW